MVIATSQDSGITWSGPVRVAADGWEIDGCPHSGPALGLLDSTIVAAWYTGAHGRASVKVALSAYNGHTFKSAKEVQRAILDANYPHMTVAGGKVWGVLQGRNPDERGGWGHTRSWLIRTPANEQATVPVKIPFVGTSASYPRIFIGNAGRIYAIWTDMDIEGQRVVLCRGRIRE